MIQRFLGGGFGGRHSSARRAATQTVDSASSAADHASSMGVPRGLKATHSPVTPTNEFFVPQDDWSLVSKVAVASLTSQGTMGGIIVTGAVYGAVYAYERLTWTSQAKCREFKRQYVDHAARKLRLIVDMTSANCSHQVQQELSSTFARLCHLVDETTGEMKDDIKRIDAELAAMEENAARSKVLKNQASFITNKLEMFEQTYLADGSGGASGSE